MKPTLKILFASLVLLLTIQLSLADSIFRVPINGHEISNLDLNDVKQILKCDSCTTQNDITAAANDPNNIKINPEAITIDLQKDSTKLMAATNIILFNTVTSKNEVVSIFNDQVWEESREKKELKIFLPSGETYVYDKQNNLIARTERGDTGSYELLDKGKVIGLCRGKDCDGNPENKDNIYSTTDGYCKGSKDTCFEKEGASKKSNWKSIRDAGCDATSGWGDECDAMYKARGERAPLVNFEKFVLSRAVAEVTGSILNLRPGWEALSAWWFPELNSKWQKAMSESFDKFLGAEFFMRQSCDSKSADTIHSNGESAVYIEVSPGQTQSVASIHAEKTTTSTPALCAADVPCSVGECREDGICYDPQNDEPIKAYLYKINWMVRAPADEKSTPYLDENGYSVFYNIEIRGGPSGSLFLYPADSYGSTSTLSLKNGQTDKDLYITYSPHSYDEICILFAHGPKDMDGDEVKRVCTDFALTTEGSNPFGTTFGSGSSQPSTRVADVGRKQI